MVTHIKTSSSEHKTIETDYTIEKLINVYREKGNPVDLSGIEYKTSQPQYR